MATDLQETNLTPLSLIATAIERTDIDPDRLGKLMDLHERWTHDKAREAYMSAMKACKESLPIVVRDAENSHTRSRYARLETVSQKVDPIITRHGFSLSYGTAESNKDDHVRIVCDCMHEGGHSQQYQLDCPYDSAGSQGTKNKTAIQAMGSTISYGRRYLKLMIFDVTVANEDNDGIDAATIGPGQTERINTLLDQIQATDEDFARFLAWAGVDTLDKMPITKFDDAVRFLNKKLEQRKPRNANR